MNGTHQGESLICCGAFNPHLFGRGLDLQENGSGISSTPAKQFAHSQLPAQGLKLLFVCLVLWSPPDAEHSFSAFWLCSCVVSVLISVTADMSPIGDLHVAAIFLWGDVALSLLKRSYVLPCPGTLPGAAHPTTLGSTIHRRLFARRNKPLIK